MKSKISVEEFVKKRNLAVCSMDVDVFKEWYKEMVECGAFLKRELPADNVLEITMRKMACEITNIPTEVKLKAAEWLLIRGYRPCIYDGDTNNEVNT